MSQTEGQLVVLSGPSGVGKSTLLRRLLSDFSSLIPSISATTRPPRTGEKPGVDYHFLSPEEFENAKKAARFIECCQVYGREYWYGTLEDEVTPRLTHGKWVILEIDVEGTLS
ncbi:MAG TPA: guanylate kinase, partial [Planctomycetaceae bacterium]|nr:guanylate kinase [Planctomycetaceae bacterium]